MSRHRISLQLLSLVWLLCGSAEAQPVHSGSNPVSPKPGTAADILGRTTPRGTVLGFLRAGRNGDDETAAQYLNTRLRGQAAAVLAHQLFIVLDRRLPARLNELSDRPEGSLAFLTRPDQDLVGTINSDQGNVDILLEKVSREKTGAIWLFSRETLQIVPEIFEEVDLISIEHVLPAFLVHRRIAQIALFEWLCVFLGLPLLYLLTGLLNRAGSSLVGGVRRRLSKDSSLSNPVILPKPARLLIVAVIIRWMLTQVTLPLLARQFWSGIAAFIILISVVCLFILLNGWCEDLVRKRFDKSNHIGATAILRLGRRSIDLLGIFVGILVGLRYFGVNPTAALAGLGVGGIAVALAAQKTLENVIGGISIVFDKVVRVGDTLNTGTTLGTVESVGLRSTRIRTTDRTLVSVPNGQLANVQLENFSVRDKFWFHPNICLRYETTADMMRAIIACINSLLTQHSHIDSASVRVRFLRFGASSLDIEIFAYIFATSWPHFLEIQEELLLQIMGIIEEAGAEIAFPSQTMYLASDHGREEELAAPFAKRKAR